MTTTKTIHQIWLGGNPLPLEFAAWAMSWRAHHPDWEYKLWTEQEAEQFDLYRRDAPKTRGLSAKSNLLRLLILASEGGMYADFDYECRGNFEALIEGKDVSIFECPQKWKDEKPGWTPDSNIAWIYSPSGSATAAAMIDVIESSCPPAWHSRMLSGDWMRKVAAKRNLELNLLDHRLGNAFAPWEEIPEVIPFETLAIHHWEGSWLEDEQRAALNLPERKIAKSNQ